MKNRLPRWCRLMSEMRLNRVLSVTTAVVAVLIFSLTTRVQGQTGWGNALSFDGTDDYVHVSGFGTNAPTNEITIEFWQKVSTVKGQLTFASTPNQSANRITASSPWSDGRAYWDFGDQFSGGRLSYLPPAEITNSWQHFAFVASQSGNVMRIYRNGVLEAEKPGMTPFVGGALDLNLGGYAPYLFEGQLDEFRIWNVARSGAEIQANMNQPMTGTESNLIACWHFNETGGTIAYDATTNHFDATLVNVPVWTDSTIPSFININAGLPAVDNSSVAWGDYDNDGRLDILLAGRDTNFNLITEVWRNTGNGFTNIKYLPGVQLGFAEWVDYDNDGRLDIMLSGIDSDNVPITDLFWNTGSGFDYVTPTVAPGLPGVYYSSVAWGDYDNDGLPDFLLMGTTNGAVSGTISQLWRNTGSGFGNVTAAVMPDMPAGNGKSAWGDYDNDGRLDILLTSTPDGFSLITQIWRNTSSGFTNINAGLPGVYGGSTAWGDYDSDGLLDILLTGVSDLGNVSQVWRNTGSSFTNINAGMPGVREDSAAWGDYDSDGRLDVLLTGTTNGSASGALAQVWRNTSNGFTNINLGLPGTYYGSVAWGDYDNDGRLDFLLSGYDGANSIAQVWRNVAIASNTPPAAPANLIATPNGSGVSLSWDAATDGQTPADGLTYNLRVGTTPGGSDIVSPLADSATGFRRLPALGNAQHGLTALLTNLPVGICYWSVQAVDTSFVGSPFATEEQWLVARVPDVTTLPATDLRNGSATLNGTVNPRALNTTAWFEWGLTTNYGSSTLVTDLSGTNVALPVSASLSGLGVGTTYHFRLVATNSLGVATSADATFAIPIFADSNAGLPGVSYSSVDLGDYNNDGRLDLLLTGTTNGSLSGSISEVWRNNGDGTFSNINAALPGVNSGSVAWGDYDNDGWLDILLTGLSVDALAPITQIWHNNGDGKFSNVTAGVAPGLPGLANSSVAWGDYDNDGRLDILLTGITNLFFTAVTQIWRNTGSGFTHVTDTVAPGLPGVSFGSVAWGDYDNDGRLDFLLTGLDSSFSLFAQVWRNTGGGFADVTGSVAPGLSAVCYSSVAWGDYDNDGRLDFLLTGQNNSAGGIAQVWRNNGGGTFSKLNAGLPGIAHGSVAWGDYDNDGRLDILLTGDASGNVTQVWRSTGSGFTNINDGLPGVDHGSVAWVDYDNDGRLDFVMTGQASGGVAQVRRNTGLAINTPPAAPANLTATAGSLEVRLSWDAATDGQTPASGLTYNVRAGTTPGGTDLLAGQVNPANGFRRVAAQGNAQLRLTLPLARALDGLTFYWSVQAVDSAFAGGAFATEQQSVVSLLDATALPPSNLLPDAATLRGTVYPGILPATAWFQWGTTTNYGNTTPVTNLKATNVLVEISHSVNNLIIDTTYHFRLVASNELGLVIGADAAFTTPSFTDLDAGLEGLGFGSAAWGDYDNDGRLDLLLTGAKEDLSVTSQIWRNTGTGFSNVTAVLAPGLAGVMNSSVAWGDYDNDGQLDFMLTGDGGFFNGITQLWRNTGSGFTNLTAIVAPGLPAVRDSSVAWGDYDNDGRLDILLTGFDELFSPTAQVWRNTGAGFTNATASVAPGLPGVFKGSVAWGDYDNDGWLDILLTGSDMFETYGQVWRNTGSGFTNVTASVAPGLPAVFESSVAWGDYNNDGRLDFLVTGLTNNDLSGFTSEVWQNTGNGFTNVTDSAAPGLPALINGSVAWGDYDNDGWLDLLLTGETNSLGRVTQIWRNTGNGFTNVSDRAGSALPNISFGSAAWGDHDNDGRLDMLLVGNGSFGQISQLWRNETPLTNAPPAAPTGLAMTATATAVLFSWNSATDDHTPATGLNYNVRAGTTPGGSDLLGAHVNPVSGFRRVPAMGNASLRHSLPLTGVTNGQTIYWSVQAVDTSFSGGPFATETSLVSLPLLSISPNPQPSTLNLSWTPPTRGWMLQQSTDPGEIWTNAPSGDANSATISTINSSRFYRLFNP